MSTGNPFIRTEQVSQEDVAAFMDQAAKQAVEQQEHYQKGFSTDDPAVVEENKLQDSADQQVETQIENIEQVLTPAVSAESSDAIEAEDLNPFLNNTVAAEKEATEVVNETSETNPFLSTAVVDSVDVDGDAQPDLVETAPTPVDTDAVIGSLESIREDLCDTMEENKLNPRNTEFVVDVQLEDESKDLLDADITSTIAQAPEMLESLESIVVCRETSVPAIIQILDDKIAELKAVTAE